MSRLLTLPHFVDAAAVLDQVRDAPAAAATVYGGRAAVESNVRRTKKLVVPQATRDAIVGRLMEEKDAIAAHFGIAVDECEEPQFLRYEAGDFFVAHQDGNTPLIRDFTLLRKISLVIFLSDPAAYDGGALVFHWRDAEPETARVEAGTLIAFRAETTHEVTPLTRGERFTIAAWYRVRG
ncbi:MAG TPA: 2OG-Fe(II) oxygenase [Thermoanaerobaculia bacterium]|jgi:SM-20-related protein